MLKKIDKDGVGKRNYNELMEGVIGFFFSNARRRE